MQDRVGVTSGNQEAGASNGQKSGLEYVIRRYLNTEKLGSFAVLKGSKTGGDGEGKGKKGSGKGTLMASAREFFQPA